MKVDYKDSKKLLDEKSYSISSISNPQDHSIVYIMKKIQDKLVNLRECNDCFVFYQKGIEIPSDLEEKHYFCETEDASKAFSDYIEEIYGERLKKNRLRKYTLTNLGYTVGENVSIGEGTFIEPGVFIDHDVVIGKNCVIKHGAILRDCVIGDSSVINEAVLVGNSPYYFHLENGVNVRSIPVGNVTIKDNVDIGAHSVVDRGTVTDTIIYENVKIDTYVHIGHDAIVHSGALITSTSIVGGFCEVGENSEICSATLMKRTKIGRGAFVGLNSGVLSDVADEAEVFGYPARTIKKGKE